MTSIRRYIVRVDQMSSTAAWAVPKVEDLARTAIRWMGQLIEWSSLFFRRLSASQAVRLDISGTTIAIKSIT